MASETDFAFDELGNSMENNYETESNNALGTSLMDIYVWEDDDISKSIEVLGTSLIDKLGSSLQEDRSKSHDASDTSVIEEHITFQEDNMTKKDNVDAFRSSITSTKPTDSNSGFLNIQLENPSFTERTKDTFLTMEDDPYDFTIEVENCEDQYIIQDVSRDLFSFKIKPLITSTPKKSKAIPESMNVSISGQTDENMHEENLSTSQSYDLSIYNYSFDEACKSNKNKQIRTYGNSKLLAKAMQDVTTCLQRAKQCENYCLKGITEAVIKQARYRYWTKCFESRVEWFFDKIAEGKDKKGNVSYFTDGGKRVCGFCFRCLYRIDKNFYYKYIKKSTGGTISAGYRKGRGQGQGREHAISWLQDYAYYHADRMPDNGDMMLPYKSRKLTVYEQYLHEKTEMLHHAVSRSTFSDIWNKSFHHLKIKQTNSFSKCSTCVHIERELEKTRDQGKRMSLKRLMSVHNDRQMTERRYYYDKREKARLQPGKYMSVIIDGMDQSKTSLPHFTGRLQKGVDPSSLLKTHVQGVLNHGRKTFDTYVDLNEYCHDSNLIMNVLLRTVHDSIGKDGKLPEILYIQADNCGRENKNKFMLGFCDLLVRLAVFREVHLSFLYVGHTHEDIDAAFSRIAEKLRTEDAETLPKLLHVLQGGRKLQGLFDIKQWMEPHINQIKHHSKPLHFLFSKDAEGDVCVLYKGNSRRPWKRLECTILNNVPVGKPVVLLPSKVNKINISAIRSNVERCRYRMSGGDGQYQWWIRFLNEMSEISQSEQRMKEYASAQAYWLLPNLKNKVFLHNITAPEINVAEHLQEMVDKELEDPVKTDEENTVNGYNDPMCRLYVEKRSMEQQNRIYMKLKQPPNERMTQISVLHGRTTRNNSMRCY